MTEIIPSEESRTCKRCKEEKLLTHEFWRHNDGVIHGHICRQCHNTRVKERYAAKRGGRYNPYKRVTDTDTRKAYLKGKPEFVYPENGFSCKACEHLADCNQRVRIGMWVKCEVPTAEERRLYAVLSVERPELRRGQLTFSK